MTTQGKVVAIALSALAVAVVAPKVGPDASLAGSAQRTYLVQPGDTLWTIADRFYRGDERASVWKIEQANHLSSASVTPGQKLVLP